MSGRRFLLDTNAIIALLHKDSDLIQLLKGAEWIGISVISHIEFLAFSGLTEADIQLFQQFLRRVEVIDLSRACHQLEKKSFFRDFNDIHRRKITSVATAMQNIFLLVSRQNPLKSILPL